MSYSSAKYLKVKKQFKLGHLTTEAFHPKSKNLSNEVKTNILKAISTLNTIDKDALEILRGKVSDVYKLFKSVKKVIDSGNTIFLSGCGATGRLAISLEKILRESSGNTQVVGFMAGGDYALIRSVESFEDNFDYGKKQLLELGFTSNDLLIGITEGGETSFVIGSVHKALEISNEKPYFVYCNPDHELISIKRSKDIIEDDCVNKLNLSVGPMAISGSTRMQATTVQMISVGFALLSKAKTEDEFYKEFNQFIDDLITLDFNFLDSFVRAEYKLYKADGIVTYKANSEIAIAVLTDTTERAPTFNLYSFENSPDEVLSLSYLAIRDTKNSEEAWINLLSRKPRCLNWSGLDRDITEAGVYAFNISEESISRREKLKKHSVFDIQKLKHSLKFKFEDNEYSLDLNQKSLFFTHICLKLIMNIHSTLLMGLMERYEGNMMTYVKPSNYKLIDRSCRYINELLRQQSINVDEDVIIKELLDSEHDIEQAIVLCVFNKICATKK